MRKLIAIGFGIALCLPAITFAEEGRYDRLQFTGSDAHFVVGGVTIQVVNYAKLSILTMGASSFNVEVAPGSIFSAKSTLTEQLSVSSVSGSTDYTVTDTCTQTVSQVTIETGTATSTLTITPDSTSLCSTINTGGSGGGGGGGGGGSGGGGGAPTVTTTTNTPTVTTTTTGTLTAEQRTALIATLTAQVQSLLAQVMALTGGAYSSFSRDLQVGATGDDVRGLQVYLNTHGYTVSSSGAGSPGNETTMFGGLTRAAVRKLQQDAGITPAAGYFGPKTRAYVAANP